LLAAGADANGGLLAGDVALCGTPLHAAVDTNDERDVATQQQMVELLLQHGADVDVRNCNGSTPLMMSVLHGSIELASMLLAAGASVSAVCSQWHMTALHYATEPCKIDMLELLLEHGADPTAADVDGELPIHGACRCGSVEVCIVTYIHKRSDVVDSVVITVALNDCKPCSKTLQIAVFDSRSDCRRMHCTNICTLLMPSLYRQYGC
jgi:ankyrin repeat protein